MSIGIYKITNLINGKCYIGQSVNIENRWAAEKRRAFLENEEEYDYPRSRAFRKYGLDNFCFEIVEECSINELNEKERYYIQHYNSLVPNGYNQTLGGQSACGVKLTKALVDEITELLKNTDLFNTTIGQLYGVSENTVCGINTGYYWKRDNIDYPIRTKIKKEKQAKTPSKKPKELLANRKVDRPDKITLAQEIVNTNFSAVGRKYGVSDNAVRKWCIWYDMPTKKDEIKKWLADH